MSFRREFLQLKIVHRLYLHIFFIFLIYLNNHNFEITCTDLFIYTTKLQYN